MKEERKRAAPAQTIRRHQPSQPNTGVNRQSYETTHKSVENNCTTMHETLTQNLLMPPVYAADGRVTIVLQRACHARACVGD